MVKESGGAVISDWADIFSLQGQHSNGGKRWVISKDDVRFTRKDGLERVFLLSDNFNGKPKYLLALALGIPCVSVEWLEQSYNGVSANRLYTGVGVDRLCAG